MVHVLLKPGLENSERHFASGFDECNLCGSLSVLYTAKFKDESYYSSTYKSTSGSSSSEER